MSTARCLLLPIIFVKQGQLEQEPFVFLPKKCKEAIITKTLVSQQIFKRENYSDTSVY